MYLTILYNSCTVASTQETLLLHMTPCFYQKREKEKAGGL